MATVQRLNDADSLDSAASTIAEVYNEAYAVIDQGICCDEVGFTRGAVDMYRKGLKLIDKAGHLPASSENVMYQKMAKAKQHILSRLIDLENETSNSPNENTEPALDAISNTLCSLGDAKSAEELLVIPDGVQLFFITADETSVPSYPSFLKVFKFCPNGSKKVDNCQSGDVISTAFLQVSDWIYPLAPNRSPVLHSTYGAYIFPNPSVDAPDSFVGVILPKDLETSVVTQFRSLMKEYAALKEEETPLPLTPQEKERLANRIANFLLNSSEYAVQHIKNGSEKASEFVRKQSDSIKAKVGDQTKTVTVDPRVQTSVHYLRQGTKITVKISGYLVEKVGVLGAAVGRRLAASVDKRLQNKASGAQTVQDVLHVTSAGVAGVATVWMALEEVSKKLAKCIANETVTVVNHTYGSQAGDVTNDVLYSAGFAALAAWNVECLGFKGIARRSAKSASLAFLHDLDGSSKEKEQPTEDKNEPAEASEKNSKRLRKK